MDASVIVSNNSDLAAPVSLLRPCDWPTGVISPRRQAPFSLWPEGLVAPHFGARIDVDREPLGHGVQPHGDTPRLRAQIGGKRIGPNVREGPLRACRARADRIRVSDGQRMSTSSDAGPRAPVVRPAESGPM